MTEALPFDDALARLAFERSPSGMLAVDGAGAIIAANREAGRLFGWAPGDLIGRPVELLLPERLRGAHAGLRAEFAAEPHARGMGAGRELRALRKDGTEFPAEIGLQPVRHRGRPVVLVTVVDISARRAMEETLLRSQRLEAIGVLAGGLAHDFNNILLGIVGHAELVLREASLDERSREDLERVVRAVGRGRDLVRRILLASRGVETNLVSTRLDRVLSEAIDLLRAALPSTIEILAELDPATPMVMCDETQIHQVIMNLGTNSAHAMTAGGMLTVRLEPFEATHAFARAHPGLAAGRGVRLTVSDSGSGMGPEVLERALEPFYTTKPPGQGTGLGLAVVNGIVQAHRGTLEIASTPGHGTTVTVFLPATEPMAPAAAQEPGEVAETAGQHILFVEDEPVLALMQRRQLEHLGYRVTAHTSSVDALEDFRARPGDFALLLTDDTMPGLTGTDLARAVLEIRPALPILMVSGGQRHEPGVLERIGIRGLLRKPHSVDEMDRAIRAVLGAARPSG